MGRYRRSSFLAAAVLAAVATLSAQSAAAQAGGLSFSVSGDWKASVFGDVGGNDKIVAENFEIAEKGEGSVFMRSSYDRGKIASSSEGIAFYYRELKASADFELKATATVAAFGKNNQVSLGIMLRDKVFANAAVTSGMGSYIAVGPISAATPAPLYTFRRTTAEGLVKAGEIKKSPLPGPGAVYKLSLKKSGSDYTLTMGDEEPIVLPGFSAFSGETLYLGLYTSRNASVTFGEVSFSQGTRRITDLVVDASRMKASYRPGEALDPAGLKVRAVYETGPEEALDASKYALLGFDSGTVGSFSLTVSAGGVAKALPYTVVPLACTKLSLLFHPLKTDYRLGDAFDPAGLRVQAVYDEGYATSEIGSRFYSLSVDGESAKGYVFGKPGKARVTIASAETPATSVSFDVSVSPAKLERLSIGRQPSKTSYFIGERLSLEGMTVYAEYSDGARLRLSPGEYSVSDFDSSKEGKKSVKVAHKKASAALELLVRKRSPLGLALAARPRTTYAAGEAFDPRGLELVRAYDDGYAERLDPSLWSADLSRVDFSKPGLYEARLALKAGGLPPLSLPIAVRADALPAWKTIRFGQSSSDAKNYVEVLADGAARLVALEGGGKVTGDHDGMTFYYVELDAAEDNFTLSADIKVIAYAKDPQDGQESFGIMARDILGPAGDSGIAASNMAAVGGYSGGTRSPNGTQLFARTGVASPSGAGSAGVRSVMLQAVRPEASNTFPAMPYRLSLSKTNSGFTARLNDGEPQAIWEPELLAQQDGKMYVGFFAARLATIEVSGIRLELSSGPADAPRVSPPLAKPMPRLDILSSDKSPRLGYSLVLRPSAAGFLTVKSGTEVLVRDREVEAGVELALPAPLAIRGRTAFVAALAPDDRQELASYATVIASLAVTQRIYVPGGDIRVSPAGTAEGAGTAASPLDLDTAIAYVREGQRIVLADGRYPRSKALVIPRYVDGSKGREKAVVAARGARPILDFARSGEGVVLSGSWWRFSGIDITNTAPNAKGLAIGGNDNVIEDCRFYGNGDTGCQISRTDAAQLDKAMWPSRNLILRCESFDNRDPSENNADGFAAKLTSGEGNVFRDCVSHNNIDDGWDLYTKAGTGAIGAVLIEGCVAYGNGALTTGAAGKGDKNGFKLGGEGIAVPHLVRDSLSYGNGAAGFTANSNPAIRLEGAFALDNAGPNFSFATYAGALPAFVVGSAYSFKTAGGTADALPAQAIGGSYFDGASSRSAGGGQLSRADFDAALGRAGLKAPKAAARP